MVCLSGFSFTRVIDIIIKNESSINFTASHCVIYYTYMRIICVKTWRIDSCLVTFVSAVGSSKVIVSLMTNVIVSLLKSPKLNSQIAQTADNK